MFIVSLVDNHGNVFKAKFFKASEAEKYSSDLLANPRACYIQLTIDNAAREPEEPGLAVVEVMHYDWKVIWQWVKPCEPIPDMNGDFTWGIFP